jgi:hypothetical protein
LEEKFTETAVNMQKTLPPDTIEGLTKGLSRQKRGEAYRLFRNFARGRMQGPNLFIVDRDDF